MSGLIKEVKAGSVPKHSRWESAGSMRVAGNGESNLSAGCEVVVPFFDASRAGRSVFESEALTQADVKP